MDFRKMTQRMQILKELVPVEHIQSKLKSHRNLMGQIQQSAMNDGQATPAADLGEDMNILGDVSINVTEQQKPEPKQIVKKGLGLLGKVLLGSALGGGGLVAGMVLDRVLNPPAVTVEDTDTDSYLDLRLGDK